MKQFLLALLIVLPLFSTNAQNVYRFRYSFTKKTLDSALYLKSGKIKKVGTSTNNYFIRTQLESGKYIDRPYQVTKKDTSSVFLPKGIAAESILGIIKKRDGDTLMLDFWGYEEGSGDNAPSMVNKSNIDSTFYYVIPSKAWGGRYPHLQLPFRATVFAPTSIPFRVRLNGESQLETSFLNAGVSYLWIWGKTKFYKEEEIEPRVNFRGIGPFLGFSELELDKGNTDDKVTESRETGSISYGVNYIQSIHNFNIIFAIGFENAVGKDAGKWEYNSFKGGAHPWIGFGVGLKVLDLAINPVSKD